MNIGNLQDALNPYEESLPNESDDGSLGRVVVGLCKAPVVFDAALKAT